MRPARRRRIAGLAALLALPAARPAAARTGDLVVLCDKALGPPLLAVARAYRARTGVRIVVFPTSPGLILAQLRREGQNDIVATDLASIVAAAREGIVAAAREGIVAAAREGIVAAAREGIVAAGAPGGERAEAECIGLPPAPIRRGGDQAALDGGRTLCPAAG